MPEPSDDDLVQRCLEATQAATEAFESLYSRHAGAVYAFLGGLHRHDEHAARDALQETFFRFYKESERPSGRSRSGVGWAPSRSP